MKLHDFSEDIRLQDFLATKGQVARGTVYEKDGVKTYGFETVSGVNIKLCKKLNDEILAGKKLDLQDPNLRVQKYETESGETRFSLYRKDSALKTAENIFA